MWLLALLFVGVALIRGSTLRLQGSTTQRIVFGDADEIEIMRVNRSLYINSAIHITGDIRTTNASLEDLMHKYIELKEQVDALEAVVN